MNASSEFPPVPDSSPGTHLRPEELASFLGAGILAAGRTHVHEHLAECAECRGEAIEVARLVRAAAQPGRLRLLAPLALAAGLAVVAMVATFRQRPEAVLRSGNTSAVVEAVAPRGPVARSAGPVSFVWRPVAGAVEYRVAVLDATGSPVWSVVISDSTVVVPVGVSLAPGADYYWYVDALLSDGESLSSGAQRFFIVP